MTQPTYRLVQTRPAVFAAGADRDMTPCDARKAASGIVTTPNLSVVSSSESGRLRGRVLLSSAGGGDVAPHDGISPDDAVAPDHVVAPHEVVAPDDVIAPHDVVPPDHGVAPHRIVAPHDVQDPCSMA